MKHIEIRSTSHTLSVSSVIMGSTYFDTKLPADQVYTLLDEYFSLGGNCIDTARVYGQPDVGLPSASEEVIGRYLRERPGLREKILLSTKGGHPPLSNMHAPRLEESSLRADLSGSLKSLGTGYVDIYFLHRDNPAIPVEEIMPILDSFVKERKVKCLGASNWSCARIEEANRYALAHGLTPFSVSQIQWSLAVTTPAQCGDDTLVCMTEPEYRWYRENRFPVLCYSSQSKGFFSKAIAQGTETLNEKIRARFLTPENLDKLEKVKALCAEHDLSPAAAVLLYLTHNHCPAAAIIGCSTLEQLRDSLSGQDFVPEFPPFDYQF